MSFLGSIVNSISNAWSQGKNRDAAKDTAQRDYERQKEFAQMGIRWKAEDAQKAGLHPLAALGSSGASYTPSAVSVGGYGDLGLGAIADSVIEGQNTARAKNATATPMERQLQQLSLERAMLENERIRASTALTNAQIADLASGGRQPRSPSMPGVVGPPAAPVSLSEHSPVPITPTASTNAHTQYGINPSFEVRDTPVGRLALPNSSMAEQLEAMTGGSLLGTGMFIKENFQRWWDNADKHGYPTNTAPADMEWKWNPWKRSWSLVPNLRRKGR